MTDPQYPVDHPVDPAYAPYLAPGTPPASPPAPPPGYPWRTLLIVLGSLVAVVAAVLVVVLAVLPASDPPHFAVPEKFDGYTQTHGADAQRVRRAFGSSGGLGSFVRTSTTSVWAKDSGDITRLVTFVSTTSGSAATQTEQVMSGALGSDGSAYPLDGGSLRCGEQPAGGDGETVCAFADGHVLGIVISVNPALDPSTTAVLAQRFRDVVEHRS
jgi:hypothetical protein